MSVYGTVVVGTDGSATASEAVRRCALLAGRFGARLLVVSAFQRPREEDQGPASTVAGQSDAQLLSVGYQSAVQVTQDAATAAARLVPGLVVDTATPEGDPAEALLRIVEHEPAALLATGSQGMTGSRRFLLGSVPNKLSHHMASDLLILRTGEGRAEAAPATVLAGTDGSMTALQALDRAIAVAAALGARLTILTVSPDTAAARNVLAQAAERAAAAGVAHETLLRPGDPSETIVTEGARHDLVVVGNRGMTGAGRFLLGSVPNKVSHHATSDLLIVKTTERMRGQR